MTEGAWYPEALRRPLADAIRSYRESIVGDLQLDMEARVPEGRACGSQESLVSRVVDRLVFAVSGGDVAENGVLDLAGDHDDALDVADVFAAVRLAERAILRELSADPQFGATGERWAGTTEIVRTAAFDVLAAVCGHQSAATSSGPYDATTTLMSRAVFDIAVAKELQRAVRYHHPLALILLEIDNLAVINETHGYGVGTRVLERLGVFMQEFFRLPDWVARYRADAIAVLLPETITRDAQTLAEDARQAIEKRLVFPDKDERPVGVTASAAVVTVTLRGESGEEHEAIDTARVMAEAEAAVMRARARGGNTIERVEVARDSLSVTEAATLLRCSPGTIRRLVGAGTLPAIRAAGRTRIDRIALEAYRKRHPRAARTPSR